jgi:hypothetical protein
MMKMLFMFLAKNHRNLLLLKMIKHIKTVIKKYILFTGSKRQNKGLKYHVELFCLMFRRVIFTHREVKCHKELGSFAI